MAIKYHRPAIAMIELIFAIVIMGIVMTSAPMLVSTATQGNVVALQQESINEAVSRINEILTYEWDENDLNESCIPPVLGVSSGDLELAEVVLVVAGVNVRTGRRTGVPLSTNSHTFKCNNISDLNASSLGIEGAVKNDIDDFSGNTSLIVDASGAGGVDYIEKNDTVSIATTIGYASDTATYSNTNVYYVPAGGAATSNIKSIQVILTSTHTAIELSSKQITVNAFSCNIGGFEYESREM